MLRLAYSRFDYWLFFLSFIMLPTYNFGQKITGTVQSKNGTRLEFVTVKIFSDSTLLGTTVTNRDGVYSVTRPFNKNAFKVRLSLVGYKTKDTTINTEIDLKLFHILELETTSLKEVTVLSEKPLFERKIDRLVFNVQNSMAAVRGDAFDVLSITPLVNTQNEALSIIGKGSVGLMVNDRLIKLSGDDLISYIKSIPSNTIESIEIITNPPAKYSAEGNSGLINIKLKKVVSDYWSASIRTIYTQTTYSTGNVGANFDYQKKKISVSTSTSFTDGSHLASEKPSVFYNDESWIGESKRRDFTQSYNGRVLAEYKANDKLIIGAQAFYTHSSPNSQDNSYTAVRPYFSNQVDSVLVGSGNSKNNGHTLSLNVNSTYSINKKGGKLVLDLDHYSSDKINDRLFNSMAFDAQSSLIRGTDWFSQNISNNSFQNSSANLDVQQSVKGINLNYGANYLRSKNINYLNAQAIFDSHTLFLFDDNYNFIEKTASAYLSGNKKISKKIEAQIGMRVENTNNLGVSNTLSKDYRYNYLKLFPTLYTIYRLNDSNVYTFSYGKRIDRPSYLSLNPFRRYINQNYYSVGNPFLQPSFTHNFELNYFNNKNLTVAFYSTISQNQIAQTAIPNSVNKVVVDTMQNLNNSTTIGLTLIYVFKRIKWLESNNVINGYYRNIEQHNPALVPNNTGTSLYFSTDNSFKLSPKIYSQLLFWYNSPQLIGIYRQGPKSNLSLGLRFKINQSFDCALFVNDVFKNSQARLKSNINGIAEYYANYYDNRYLRLNLTYRFGSFRVNSKQRNFKNETERQRAN